MSSTNFQQQQQQHQHNPLTITLDSLAPLQRSQMSEPPQRLNIPADYIAVRPGNYGEASEKVQGKTLSRLCVKEPNLGNGYIRKYSRKIVKKRERWYCTRCNTKRNSVRNQNSKCVLDTSYEKKKHPSKEAFYDKERNELFVSKNHSASCKPFCISQDEWQKITMPNESKPNIPLLNAAADPITFELPNLFSQPPQTTSDAATVSNQNIPLSVQLTNIVSAASPVPCSSRTILYSTNPEKNTVRSYLQNSSIFTPTPAQQVAAEPQQLFPRSAESIVTNAAPQHRYSEPAAAVVTSERPQIIAQPVTVEFETQQILPRSDLPTVANAEAQHLPSSTLAANQRASNDRQIITEGAGNDVQEEGEDKNSRELSVVTIPDDPVTIDPIEVKSEGISNMQMEIDENNPQHVVADEQMEEFEQKYDPILFTFSPGVAKIRAACKKLDLAYSNAEVFQFWGTINIEHVRSNSSNIVSGQRLDGFECLALFFTGSHIPGFELCVRINKKLENDAVMK
uniref:Uncharacterized protein n=1 Tax=Panagrolaimus sp. ES5 TaxID=591445 RepID=A0AC34F466_9BILA